MFGIGMSELIVIMIVAIIVLGPKRLPEAVKQLAKIFREVKSTVDEVKHSVVSEIEDIKKLPDETKNMVNDDFEKEFEKEITKPKYSQDYQPKREKISFSQKQKKEEKVDEG